MKHFSIVLFFLLLVSVELLMAQGPIPNWVPSLFNEQPTLVIQNGQIESNSQVVLGPKDRFMMIGTTLWDLPSESEIAHLRGFEPFRFDEEGKYLVGYHTQREHTVVWSLVSGKPVAVSIAERDTFPVFDFLTYDSYKTADVRAQTDSSTSEGEKASFLTQGTQITSCNGITAQVRGDLLNTMLEAIDIMESEELLKPGDTEDSLAILSQGKGMVEKMFSLELYKEGNQEPFKSIPLGRITNGLFFSRNCQYLIVLLGQKIAPDIGRTISEGRCLIFDWQEETPAKSMGVDLLPIENMTVLGNQLLLNKRSVIRLDRITTAQTGFHAKSEAATVQVSSPWDAMLEGSDAPQTMEELNEWLEAESQKIAGSEEAEEIHIDGEEERNRKIDSLEQHYGPLIDSLELILENLLEEQDDPTSSSAFEAQSSEELYTAMAELQVEFSQEILLEEESPQNGKQNPRLDSLGAAYDSLNQKLNELIRAEHAKQFAKQQSMSKQGRAAVLQNQIDSLGKEFYEEVAKIPIQFEIPSSHQKQVQLSEAYTMHLGTIQRSPNETFESIDDPQMRQLLQASNQLRESAKDRPVYAPDEVLPFQLQNETYYVSWAGINWHLWQQNHDGLRYLYKLGQHERDIDRVLLVPERNLAVSFEQVSSAGMTYGENKGKVLLWDLSEFPTTSPVLLRQFQGAFGKVLSGYYDASKEQIVFFSQETLGQLAIHSLHPATGEIRMEKQMEVNQVETIKKVPGKKELLAWGRRSLIQIDPQTFSAQTIFTASQEIEEAVCVSPNEFVLLLKDRSVQLLSLEGTPELELLDPNLSSAKAISFSSVDQTLWVATDLGELHCYQMAQNKRLFSILLNENEQDWMMLLPEGYYAQTDNKPHQELRLIHKGHGLPFDQFDLRLNRPDKVLQALHPFGASSSLARQYRLAYNKRLERYGFTENIFSDDYHLPQCVIENQDNFPLATDKPTLKLSILAVDSLLLLDQLNIFINDVPLYGISGINLRDQTTREYRTTLEIPLTVGPNKIQVSALNQGGAESLKATTYITYDAPERKPDLYLATIGVSDYQSEGKDLQYAAKDAHDIDSVYQAQKAFATVHRKHLTDAQVTKDNILALRDWLEQSQVDDQVIIYVSGHGILDENYDFYYGTHDIDFANPAERGILYEDIESLLDGIPARKKLLLMDACHSGEYDADAKPMTQAQRDSLAARGVSFKGFAKDGDGPVLGLQNSFDLMQQLFVDLRRGSGATVITSSSGVQVSYEDKDWANGAFTYAFLYGLKTMAADANGDEEITASEIQAYVAEKVPQLTEGLQVPTFRRENLEYDFRVW